MKRTISQHLTFLLFISILSVALHAESISDKVYGSAVVSEVTSVYDGDTFRVNLEGYPELIGYRIGIRINGIDTPEMRGQCPKEKELARQAKMFSVQQLRSAKVIELKNMKRGKYFRIVADVFVDGRDLAQMLIDHNLAVAYDGGHKAKEWCK